MATQANYGQTYPNTRTRTINPLYGVAAVGGVLLAVSSFLAWYNFNITGSGGESFSITGMGGTSGTSEMAKFLAATASNAGIISVFLGGMVLLPALLGLALNKKGFAIATLVFALMSVAFMVLKLSQAAKLGSDLGDSAMLTTSVGLGLYLGLLGAIIALVGSVLPLVMHRR